MKKVWIKKNRKSNEVGLINLTDALIDSGITYHEYKNEIFIKPILFNNEVVEGATKEEIQQIEKEKVPVSVRNIQLRNALLEKGIMPSDISKALHNLPSETDKQKKKKEQMINFWEYEDLMPRMSPYVIEFVAKFKILDKELDNLFIIANTKI